MIEAETSMDVIENPPFPTLTPAEHRQRILDYCRVPTVCAALEEVLAHLKKLNIRMEPYLGNGGRRGKDTWLESRLGGRPPLWLQVLQREFCCQVCFCFPRPHCDKRNHQHLHTFEEWEREALSDVLQWLDLPGTEGGA
jgi:hypothetical protein